MNTLKRINWLASYPKSGNTWVRCFLRAYQFDAYEPIDINRIGRISKSDSRQSWFEELLAEDGTELTDEVVNSLRYQVQKRLATEIGEHQVAKTHNARVIVDGTPLIQEEFTRRVVYVVRNPLDVVDSLADHTGTSIDEAIQSMNDSHYCFGGMDRKFVRQYLTTWSNHVISWTQNITYPLLVLRFEDLLANPVENFRNLIRFLGWMYDEDRVNRSIRFSSFESLKASETAGSFEEVSDASTSGTFFLRGKAEAWSATLSADQIAQVRTDHETVMRQLGYICTDSP